MSSITSGQAQQYGDSRKLAARARLHSQYTIAETPWFTWVAESLPLRQGDRLLDVGCGPGWFWETAAGSLPKDLDLTLTDLSPGMVQEALLRCAPLGFAELRGQTADASALPFESGSLDGVMAMHMLYHLPDPALAIAEAFRVLKPGGFLAVTTNGMGNMRQLYQLTTVFGSEPFDPAAAAFGFGDAERLMRRRFGEVTTMRHAARMLVTEPDDVFLALTSYPPGEGASAEQLAAFRAVIDEAFRRGDGVLEVEKEVALFLSRKAA